MSSSYFITEIENNLKRLGQNPDSDQQYNQIFDEKDGKAFARKLRSYNELINRQIDKMEMDGEDD